MNKIILVCICITFLSCFCEKEEINNIIEEHIDFSINYDCLSVTGALCNSIKGEFALDNGMSISLLDSTYFYSNFDLSNYMLIDPNSYKYFGHQMFSGEIKVKIGYHSFVLNRFLVKDCSKLGIPKLNGIIGTDAFLNKITIIDFENQIIDFLDSITQNTDCYFKVPFLPSKDKSTNDNSKFITIDLFDKSGLIVNGHMLFDLGCIGTELHVKRSFADMIKKTKTSKNGDALLTTAQKTKTEVWQLDSIYVYEICLKNIQMTTSYVKLNDDEKVDPMLLFDEGDGYLGLDLIKKFGAIIMDYKNNILYLRKP